ncbi:Thymidylate synthase [uncultured archaeon]|nr:Thymidylate synthase [uncultured archaeon]
MIKSVIEELLFFLRGDTNTKHLEEKGVNIWKYNTSREFLDSVKLNHYDVGDMGAMYGYQWIHYGAKYDTCNHDYSGKGVNQIDLCIDLLINDPFSRRIIMTDFNPIQVNEGCLYPCHSIIIQFYVRKLDSINYVSIQMYQRSADMFLGIPFNILSTSLLLYIICEIINNKKGLKQYVPDKVIIILGDYHIYNEHYTQATRQLLHIPLEFPTISFNKQITDYKTITCDDIKIDNYKSYPFINAKMIP